MKIKVIICDAKLFEENFRLWKSVEKNSVKIKNQNSVLIWYSLKIKNIFHDGINHYIRYKIKSNLLQD